MKRLWIIGSGGHAKVVIDTARAIGNIELAGLLDDDPNRIGQCVSGIEIIGSASIESIESLHVEHAVIAIGSNRARAEVARRLRGLVVWATLIHPRAYVTESSAIGAGTVIFAGAIVQPGCTIGDHVILNTQCGVDHDATIGNFVHIAPGSQLAGNVQIMEGAFIGLSAGIIPGKRVGAWAMIGAGAMVVDDIADRLTVVGVPARPPR